MMRRIVTAAALVAAFGAGYLARGGGSAEPVVFAQGSRVFELRTYTTAEGKLDLLHTRFRDHTLGFFERHGMTNVLYGRVLDAPRSENTLVYLLAYPDRDAARRSWEAFRADPDWATVVRESGVGQVQVESLYFEPTDYSPMK
ncbi:MAG: NIPSNAP family protein [Vicinamibacterales bacterium]